MFIWPFRTKDQGQFRRIDQGWDLQGPGPAEEQVLAVADGVVGYAHDPGGGGAHFGDPYVVLHLLAPDGRGTSIYYGHTKPLVAEGSTVRQGDVVATTTSPGGGGAPDHWLEIGFWIAGPTGDGQAMHDALIDAPTWAELEGDMPLSDADIQRIDTDTTKIVQEQIALACQPGGQIHDFITAELSGMGDNLNAHTGKLVNTIADMLGFQHPVTDQQAWPTRKIANATGTNTAEMGPA